MYYPSQQHLWYLSTQFLIWQLSSPSPQNVFPELYGPEYDSALENLVLEFLSKVEELLPAPDLRQVSFSECYQLQKIYHICLQSQMSEKKEVEIKNPGKRQP